MVQSKEPNKQRTWLYGYGQLILFRLFFVVVVSSLIRMWALMSFVQTSITFNKYYYHTAGGSKIAG